MARYVSCTTAVLPGCLLLLLPLICDDVYDVIESYLNRENDDDEAIKKKIRQMKIDYLLDKHEAVIIKNGEYVRPYREGDRLLDGENVIRSKYKFF